MVNCPNCATSNPETASLCVNCGRPLNAPPPPPVQSYTPPPPPPRQGGYTPPSPGGQAPLPNYLLQSILVTLCCCLPLGIVAIIFAAQVNSKLAAGDYAGAQEASRNAKKWCWIAFGVGIVFQIIWMIFFGGMAFLEGIQAGYSG